MANVLKIDISKPWIKSCNKKVVIAFNVCNKNEEPLEDVYILMHGTTGQTKEYVTKIFDKTDHPPFWKETESQMLRPKSESAIVVVIDVEEIKYNVTSKVEFSGVMVYKKSNKECILPMDDVNISSLDTMGHDFDVLCTNTMDSKITLAVLASTERTDLLLRLIKADTDIQGTNEECLSINIFCKYLQMELIPKTENIVIHRKSPYHILNGVMIIAYNEGQQRMDQLALTVQSRSPSQVLALMHLIHDAVPLTIVITTPAYKIIAKNNNLSVCNESTVDDILPNHNYFNYASSILNRTGLILEYLDNSMVQMSESKNRAVQEKIGSEIDLFAQGEARYKEFKDKMREEAAAGVKMLHDSILSVHISDEMSVD